MQNASSKTITSVTILTIMVVALLALAHPSAAQPANDDCSGATAVGEGTFPFDNSTATDDGLGCDGIGPEREVWFAYTATATGLADCQTSGFSADSNTVIAVYDDCARSTTLACNDDCLVFEGPSHVQVLVVQGSTYLIEVGSAVAGPAVAGDLVITNDASGAPTVLSGEDITFTKLDYADPALASNQDAIAPSVALTRGDFLPLFNAVQEPSYTGSECYGAIGSPIGTRWALGRASDWPTLRFYDLGGLRDPLGDSLQHIPGVDLVLHILQENIVLDLRFNSWTSGMFGGGFSYDRAVDSLAVTGVEDLSPVSASGLRGVYPNPVPPVATIQFELARAAHANIELLDVSGRRVRTIASRHYDAGLHTLQFGDGDAQALPSGVYFVRLQAGQVRDVAKIVITK